MSSLNVPPTSKFDSATKTWIETTFRRIEDTINLIPQVMFGNKEITGGLEIPTGLIYVDICVASLISDPVSGASFVSAVPVNVSEIRNADYGSIQITVFNSSYAVSSVPVQVGWIAVGTTRIR